jgi:hypothetical protein
MGYYLDLFLIIRALFLGGMAIGRRFWVAYRGSETKHNGLLIFSLKDTVTFQE